jgi:hypothetical protein
VGWGGKEEKRSDQAGAAYHQSWPPSLCRESAPNRNANTSSTINDNTATINIQTPLSMVIASSVAPVFNVVRDREQSGRPVTGRLF